MNPLQEALVRRLHQLGASLCVVGDDDQTIYQWRGSDVGNIIDFSGRYPKVKQIPLNENFRSSAGIVEAARKVVERNPERLPKKMISTEAQPLARGDLLALREHVEKVVELKIEDGIVVSGRIDLIRRTDTDETVIVDFKSDERAQTEEITRRQLQVYALGYQQLTGKSADLIEVHNLDKGGASREVIEEGMLQDTVRAVAQAGRDLRENRLDRLEGWCGICERCDHAGLCRPRE